MLLANTKVVGMSQADVVHEPQPLSSEPEATKPSHPSEGARWTRRYAYRLQVTDVLVVGWAITGAYLLRFGWEPAAGLQLRPFGLPGGSDYLVLSIGLLAAWLASLALNRSRDHRVVGLGPEEYKRVMTSSFQLFGVVAILAYVLQIEVARGYVAVAFPLGMVGLLLSRWMWRQWLHAVRRSGGWSAKVVAVGGADHVRAVVDELDRATFAGYHVVGVCVPPGSSELRSSFGPLPVVGGLHDVAAAVASVGAEAVVVTAAPSFGPTSLRRLAWALEGSGVDLIVAPSLTDIAGPRIHSRPVAGLPLLHVEAPQYEGPLRLAKDLFERLAALLGLIALSPLFAVVAVLIATTSRGPVFYRQERVGKGSRSFQMTKFRSMVVDAHQLLTPLATHSHGNELLFKLRDDPRITRVGRFLRRYSIDELPQLVDVLRGDMSLVGPRPPLATEVAKYGEDVHRRLLVKPGMTGLWQVSGRSDLSWEDSVRLDLYYVENWSLTQDLMILWKTARAVVHGSGAY